MRDQKGQSSISFPTDYCVLDLETTGLDSSFDEIIDVCLLRVRGGQITETYSSLVNPGRRIDDYIVELTGITNEDVKDAPSIADILPRIQEFLGDDIIVGQCVAYDVNFLYDRFVKYLGVPLRNDHVNIARIAKKLFPDLSNFRLGSIASALDVTVESQHRALVDCQTALRCFDRMKEIVSSRGSVDEFIASANRRPSRFSKRIDLRSITAQTDEFDESCPLFGRHCVFTGTLERMTRPEAAQLVVNLGGICDNSVTKHTNYLILGNNDYCTAIKDGKSSKHKKAEEYKLKGFDIEILPENVFYDMIDEF